MNIGNSLSAALAGLQAATSGIDLTSRNIANANDAGYTRKTQVQSTGIGGAPVVEKVQRVIDAGLQKISRDAASNTGMLDAQNRYAKQISLRFGAPADATSLSSLTSALGDRLQTLAAQPESDAAYSQVVNAARSVANNIRGLYQSANEVAANASSELQANIEAVNKDLARIDSLNKKIIANTTGDTTDLEDQRDQAITAVAEKLDLTTFQRSDGGISVYTKSGTALVDVAANTLSAPTVAGGGPVQLVVQLASGATSPSPVVARSGSLTGLLNVINTQVPALQSQLDAFAGTLTTSLSAVGVELFNDAGTTSYDPVGTPAQAFGFGARIAVNSTILNTPSLIRDGNATTPLATGDTSFIDAAEGVFHANTLTFSAAGMSSPNSLTAAAAAIITGQSDDQADLQDRLDTEQATQTSIDSLVSSKSGVNLDTEFANLLQLQQAYAANARIISTTQSLFNVLLVASGGTAVG